jgi:exopolyphosphatase/guanosine-5'-triphosphate,3'-diphosphate pyrophosphatase
MMDAVIDVGSNTVRMLIGECRDDSVFPKSYERRITRLAGGISAQSALAAAGMQRTLEALVAFSEIIATHKINKIRAVGTAALRRAGNRQSFIDQVQSATNLNIEVIAGQEEARLMAKGVLSVVRPLPAAAMIIDIGGGSTEFVCLQNGLVQHQHSYQLGVVLLSEDYPASAPRKAHIDNILNQFEKALAERGIRDRSYQLIGTAGTITTLAAMQLELKKYDYTKINNHRLTARWMEEAYQKLEPMPVSERESLVGMETGRGDLIIPGLEILLQLLKRFACSEMIVADSGLLEGLLLDLSAAS